MTSAIALLIAISIALILLAYIIIAHAAHSRIAKSLSAQIETMQSTIFVNAERITELKYVRSNLEVVNQRHEQDLDVCHQHIERYLRQSEAKMQQIDALRAALIQKGEAMKRALDKLEEDKRSLQTELKKQVQILEDKLKCSISASLGHQRAAQALSSRLKEQEAKVDSLRSAARQLGEMAKGFAQEAQLYPPQIELLLAELHMPGEKIKAHAAKLKLRLLDELGLSALPTDQLKIDDACD